jgi:hypothetical protein
MEPAEQKKRCAYCGNVASTDDHVVPRALYPPSLAASRFQRITVDACQACNNGWSDDEPHFRNVLLVAGDPNSAVRELWDGKTRRSFTYADGLKRVRDLAAQIEPVDTPEGARHMIYPARDERVLRIVRKIVRGLCHHHNLLSPVHDDQVVADIQRFQIPEEFLSEMTSAHAEEDVLQYRYGVVDEPEIHSGWLLNFYGRTPFFCIVFRSVEARSSMEATQLTAAGTNTSGA